MEEAGSKSAFILYRNFMSKRDPKQHRPAIFRNVVQSPSRTVEQAAWELLWAIDGLFPSKTRELRAIAQRLWSEAADEAEEHDPRNVAASERFVRSIRKWTLANKISSLAVDLAVEKWATDADQTCSGLYLLDEFDENGNLVRRGPTLSAYPFNETREEFLEKAGKYYDEVVRLGEQRGAKAGAVKRDVDHFRWLAAHLVGGYSYADIADPERNRLGLSAQSEKTVAGECRKLATLIGISLPMSPGPRPGLSIKRTRHRAKR